MIGKKYDLELLINIKKKKKVNTVDKIKIV